MDNTDYFNAPHPNPLTPNEHHKGDPTPTIYAQLAILKAYRELDKELQYHVGAMLDGINEEEDIDSRHMCLHTLAEIFNKEPDKATWDLTEEELEQLDKLTVRQYNNGICQPLIQQISHLLDDRLTHRD